MSYTQSEIEQLIKMPKIIAENSKRDYRLDRNHSRLDLNVESLDKSIDFKMFVRINNTFSENFSVGLYVHQREGKPSFILFRCNGPHDHILSAIPIASHHNKPHIHIASQQNIESGYKAERGAEPTDRFYSVEQAIIFFLHTLNIEGADKQFANLFQKKFNFEGITHDTN